MPCDDAALDGSSSIAIEYARCFAFLDDEVSLAEKSVRAERDGELANAG